jgi:diacylglycerol kinase
MTQLPQTPEEPLAETRRSRGWVKKFLDSCRGVKIAIRGEVNYFVHLFATAIVVVIALQLGVTQLQWCLLTLCIVGVISAEMVNSAIERLARTITREHHPEIRDALDIASGAVLVMAIGSVIVGLLILGGPLMDMLS